MANPLPIFVGTDCSGMGMVFYALRALGVAFRHRFGSDVDWVARRHLHDHAAPDVFFPDLLARSLRDVPNVDLYICGFPCQAFSAAGVQHGFNDDRGQIFFHVERYLRHCQPRAFILENVLGLESASNGDCFRRVLRGLLSLECYNIWFDMLDTSEHGVPQSRPRWYFVGILRSEDRGTFQMPKPVPLVSIEAFLAPRIERPSSTALPPASQTTARQNVIAALQELRDHGRDPYEECWVIDCDSSVGRAGMMLGIAPCLTRSRAVSGHWLSNRGRRLSTSEMCCLQGLRSDTTFRVPDSAFRGLLGNSMSQNILERLLCQVLPAAGLWDFALLHDRYALP